MVPPRPTRGHGGEAASPRPSRVRRAPATLPATGLEKKKCGSPAGAPRAVAMACPEYRKQSPVPYRNRYLFAPLTPRALPLRVTPNFRTRDDFSNGRKATVLRTTGISTHVAGMPWRHPTYVRAHTGKGIMKVGETWMPGRTEAMTGDPCEAEASGRRPGQDAEPNDTRSSSRRVGAVHPYGEVCGGPGVLGRRARIREVTRSILRSAPLLPRRGPSRSPGTFP